VTRGFLRFFVAAVLLATGAGKVLDVRGFAAVLESYGAIADWALLPLAVAIPLLELAVGLWLVWAGGLRLRPWPRRRCTFCTRPGRRRFCAA
jgi:uncharacterized membrane protein YphA (DoxX/SURF4 family)